MLPDPRARAGAGAPPRQRPRELHARRALSAGRGAGCRNFYVAAGFNSIGIASAGGRRPARWPSGSSAASRRWICGTSTSAGWRRIPGEPALSARPHGRRWSARSTPCTGRICSRRPRAACGSSVLHDRLARRGACFGARDGMGARRTGTRRPAWSRSTATATAGRTGFRARPRSTAPRARQSGSSISPRSASSGWRGPTRSRCSSASAPTTSTCRPAGMVYTQMLNSRGGIECGFDGDAGCPPTPSSSSPGPRRRRTNRTGSPVTWATRGRCSPTSPRRRRSSA